jgi:hypothetical protein
MDNPDTLAELRNKLVLLAAKWRNIDERYGARDSDKPAIRPVVLERGPPPDGQAARDAYQAATVKARETILEFGKLARAIVEVFGRDCFPASIPDPVPFVFHPLKMQENAFGTKDPIEAGKLAIVWAAATRKEWRIGVRRDFGFLVERWAASLVHGFRTKDGSDGNWSVYQDVIPLALLAFDKLATTRKAAADAQQGPQAGPVVSGGQVDLMGERYRRLHSRFLDGSQRFPHLRYIAATGHETCPEWPRVPHHSLQADTLGLSNAYWLDVTNKRPGTFFVGMNEHWLEIEGQLWHGSFYFDGPTENPHDHDDLQQQNAEIHEAIKLLELLANEAAGFLSNLPSVHPLVHFPRKPEPWHRWLEAVCATAQIEPARYHSFDVRRAPGNIFQASAILLEHLHAAAENPDVATRPLAPLNVNECDLRPALAAAQTFLAERRKADERGKFDEGGAVHLLGIARRHLAEALAPFNHPDGLTGDDATVGAIRALMSMAGDGHADSRVERIEAVIGFLHNATGATPQAAASGPTAGEAVDDSLIADFEKHLEGDRREPIVTADGVEAAKRWQLAIETRRALERLAEEKLRSDLLAAGFTDAEFCDGYNHVRNVEGDDPRAPAFHKAMVDYDRRIKAIGPYLQKRFAVETAEKAGQVQTDEQPPAQQEPPLPRAGYLGLRVDDDRRTISREGFTGVVNLQDSRIKWAIFKKLAQNRDVPVAPEAIIALWDAHGIARKPSDGTVNDAVGELRASVKAIGLTIVVKRKVGRLLAELPPPADKAKPRRRKKKK